MRRRQRTFVAALGRAFQRCLRGDAFVHAIAFEFEVGESLPGSAEAQFVSSNSMIKAAYLFVGCLDRWKGW